ncbi:unnamed protein product [Vitrella brassicaformis CCMP3155]|uniref:Uncharacterized protein n=1 Tax=Vitrella brassicaformis (strain CCMP3155) TaxID=1169540 RepID=A0A0G4EAW7_VITBC|nr:unnamed protein product [Vitrella brassicaformis CCMP3155]|eukprot:CEL92808.1 unnamed protein product [Vitrella brassicaformis CCMP3155]
MMMEDARGGGQASRAKRAIQAEKKTSGQGVEEGHRQQGKEDGVESPPAKRARAEQVGVNGSTAAAAAAASSQDHTAAAPAPLLTNVASKAPPANRAAMAAEPDAHMAPADSSGESTPRAETTPSIPCTCQPYRQTFGYVLTAFHVAEGHQQLNIGRAERAGDTAQMEEDVILEGGGDRRLADVQQGEGDGGWVGGGMWWCPVLTAMGPRRPRMR